MFERNYDWRAIIKQIDPLAEEKIGAYADHSITRESKVPRKYKELILMACSAAVRYRSSVRKHGIEAMSQGASEEEIIEVFSLVSMAVGFTAFIEGIEALGDQLTPKKE